MPIYEFGYRSLQAKFQLESGENDRNHLVLTSLPYAVKKGTLVEEIRAIVHAPTISLIESVRDESTNKTRIVLELQSGTDPEEAKAYLFEHTSLQKQSARHPGWFATAVNGIRMNWKSKLARRLIIGSWAPLLYFGAIFFMVGKVTETGMVEENSSAMGMVIAVFGPAAAEQLATNPEALRAPIWTILFYYQLRIQILAIIFMLAIVGPGLISDDLRTKAFPLYFAKPLSRTGYILGKFLTAAFFVAMVSLFPAIFLYLISILFSPGLSTITQTIPVLLRLLPVYACLLIVSGGLILALSSLTWSRRYLGFAWVAFWFLTELFSTVLGQVNAIEVQQTWDEQGTHVTQNFRRPPAWTESVSLRKNLLTVGHHLMRVDPEVNHLLSLTNGPVGSLFGPKSKHKQTSSSSRIRGLLEELRWQQSARTAFSILGAVAFVSFFILWRRIRREEVGQ